MSNKKIFIGIIAILLLVGTGSFVFAGQNNNEDNLEEDINYKREDFVPEPGTKVPVITDDDLNKDNDITDNEDESINDNNTTNPDISVNDDVVISRPNNSGNKNNNNSGNTTTIGNGGSSSSTAPDVKPPVNDDKKEESDNTDEKEDEKQEEKKQLEIKVSYKDNKNEVTIILTANKNIKSIYEDGWNIKDNIATKTFTENVNNKVIVEDYDNQIKEVPYTIDSIEEVIIPEIKDLEVSISYENKNNTVIATIKANKEIKAIFENGWSIKGDTATKTFTTNTSNTITVEDFDGKTADIAYEITEIYIVNPKPPVDTEKDKELEIKRSYSTTDLTNKVTVTLTANKNINSIEQEDDWTINGKIATKTFIANAEGKVTVTDFYGKSKDIDYKIENVDSVPLEASINLDVKGYFANIIITSDEVIYGIDDEDWIYDGWVAEGVFQIHKRYYENTTDSLVFNVYDEVKNATQLECIISGIVDKPLVTTNKNNDGTFVTIIYKKELPNISNWEEIQDGEYKGEHKAIIKLDENVDGKIEIDENTSVSYGAAPELSISYSNVVDGKVQTTNKPVTVTITSNKELLDLEGWTLSEDKKVLTKDFNKMQETTQLEIFDIDGNSTIVEYTVLGVSIKDLIITDITYSASKSRIRVFFNEGVLVDRSIAPSWAPLVGGGMYSAIYQTTEYTLENLTNGIIETFKIEDLYGNKATHKVSIKYENEELKWEIIP